LKIKLINQMFENFNYESVRNEKNQGIYKMLFFKKKLSFSKKIKKDSKINKIEIVFIFY